MIELLAVIVILAVIALIATPLIMNTINNARDSAMQRSVGNIQHALESHVMSKKALDENYTFDMSDFDYKGEKYDKMNVIFNEKDEAGVVVYKNNKCFYVEPGSNDVIIEDGLSEGVCLNKFVLTTDAACFDYSVIDGYGNSEHMGTLKIFNYNCYEGNDRGLPTITDVVIPAMIDDLPVTTISNDAFSRQELTSVVVSEGIKVIGDFAFVSNYFLKNVTLPSTLEYIGILSFSAEVYSRPNTSIEYIINNSNLDINSALSSSNYYVGDKNGIIFNDNYGEYLVAVTRAPLKYALSDFITAEIVSTDPFIANLTINDLPKGIKINYRDTALGDWIPAEVGDVLAVSDATNYYVSSIMTHGLQIIQDGKVVLEY